MHSIFLISFPSLLLSLLFTQCKLTLHPFAPHLLTPHLTSTSIHSNFHIPFPNQLSFPYFTSHSFTLPILLAHYLLRYYSFPHCMPFLIILLNTSSLYFPFLIFPHYFLTWRISSFAIFPRSKFHHLLSVSLNSFLLSFCIIIILQDYSVSNFFRSSINSSLLFSILLITFQLFVSLFNSSIPSYQPYFITSHNSPFIFKLKYHT